MSLKADPPRAEDHGATGIYVRATCDGKWGAYDIAELDADSLWEWLISRGTIEWPASVVMILMGYTGRGRSE